MPKIPRYIAPVIPQPRMSPAAVSAPSRALAGVGQQFEALGNRGLQIAGAIEKQEKDAERALKAVQIENGLRNDMDQVAESFYNRIDYDRFEDDAAKTLKDIREKYKSLVGDDQVLGLAFEKAFSAQSSSLMKVVRDKKRQVISERGLGEFQISYNQALRDYSGATSPEERRLIKTQLQMKALTLVSSHIMSLKQAEDFVHNFENNAEEVRADQWIEVDAQGALEALKGGSFDTLSPKVKQEKIEKALSKIKTQDNEERRDDERLERKLEKIRKDVQDQNELDMWEKYYNDNLTESELDNLAERRLIDTTAYHTLRDKLAKEEKAENNPVIVGNIAEAIELRNFDQARTLMEDSLVSGQIKPETYISYRKAIAEKTFGDGMSYLNKAFQPSELSTDFYWKQKWADGQASYIQRVASGENAMIAANDIVNLAKSDVIRTYNRYINPRFLVGQKNDIKALDDAKQKTIEAYRKGEINEDIYKSEMELIKNILLSLQRLEQINGSQNDTKLNYPEEFKERKIGK